MFSLFRRKPKQSDPGDDAASKLIQAFGQRLDLLADFFDGADPNERIMTYVAFLNVKPVYNACMLQAKKVGESYSIDVQIAELRRSWLEKKDDEIKSRRLWWSLVASHVIKLNESDVDVEIGGRVWAALISAVEVANGILVYNVIWTDEEKSSFLSPDPSMTRWKMSALAKYDVPKKYRSSAAWQRCEAKFDLIL